MAAVRSSGYASLGQVEAVVLETDGSFSVVGPSSDGSTSALTNVLTPSGTVASTGGDEAEHGRMSRAGN